MIRNPVPCCASCAAHHLGDAADDDGSFGSFLAANPDQAAALAAYQEQNPGDPNIQAVYYNPVTKVYGPATMPAQITPAIPGSSTTPTAASATSSSALIAGAAALFIVLSLTSSSQPARRR